MQDQSNRQRIYRARWIVPLCTPIVHNGVIRMDDSRVVAIEPFAGQADAIDLGDVAILPALVNAHTHLEFSDLEQPIGRKGISIADWLPEVIRQRQQINASEADRMAAIRRGITESRQAGVCLLGEIATKPWLAEPLAKLLGRQPASDASDDRQVVANDLSIVAFCEVLGLSSHRQTELLEWTDRQIQPAPPSNVCWGISPHSPYTVPPALLDACLDRAQRYRLPVAMHIAESLEEREFVETGGGPLRNTFEALGLPGLERYPLQVSMRQIIERLATATTGLIVHGNYLTDDEIECVAKHRRRLSVVYCPRTHAFFGHRPHPVGQLLDAGIRVVLGTDSRASNPDLNIWNEVRHLLHQRSDVTPQQVVAMATIDAADALANSQAGRIQTGSQSSGLFFVQTTASTPSQFWETLGEANVLDRIDTIGSDAL